MENNFILYGNWIHVHVHKGCLSKDTNTEVKINLHCSSHNTKIIHVQVQLAQVCRKQMIVWPVPYRKIYTLLSDQTLETMLK